MQKGDVVVTYAEALAYEVGTGGATGSQINTAPPVNWLGLPVDLAAQAESPLTGGTLVAVSGLHFAPDATLTFGHASATGLRVWTPQLISATTPPQCRPGRPCSAS